MSRTVKVSVVTVEDREAGIRSAIELLGSERPALSGKSIVLKPNFNSADPFPASTHNDTTAAIIRFLQECEAARITVAERSGIAWNSHEVADEKGIRPLLKTLGVDYVILEDLAADDWVHVPLENSHWKRGIELPKLVLDAEALVITCCLKTHAYGGHFTLSLKNAVGLVPLKSASDGYEYMKELHSSSWQRSMIAEINAAFRPDLVILDALSAFIDGGPTSGTVVHPGIILASTDRIAMDAVGVAILRTYETTPDVMKGSIFEQGQIRRAVQLGLGTESPEGIELVAAPDPESESWVQRIRAQLSK
ncbi:DUF362 domain-containing protein [Candidatus Bipolaricaulota bacterium]|nr:DUF362 domain-containing protein [Candidatus Bipolaricaulota bacterium]